MDKKILNNLKIGEQLVEMQECFLHKRNVIEVTIYKKKRNIFGISTIKKFNYPFYFNNKEVAEQFLKYSSYFDICIKTSKFTSDEKYVYLKLKHNNHYYIMIDDYNLNYNRVKFQLEKNGIWNGEINCYEQIYLDPHNNKSFMEIFNYANIGLKLDKSAYIFKMIENE